MISLGIIFSGVLIGLSLAVFLHHREDSNEDLQIKEPFKPTTLEQHKATLSSYEKKLNEHIRNVSPVHKDYEGEYVIGSKPAPVHKDWRAHYQSVTTSPFTGLYHPTEFEMDKPGFRPMRDYEGEYVIGSKPAPVHKDCEFEMDKPGFRPMRMK